MGLLVLIPQGGMKMKIRVHLMQATGDFSVPGTRQTVDEEIVRRAVGMLPMRDRDAVRCYMAGGPAPSEDIAESVRRAVVEVAERKREQALPSNGKTRSPAN
jgi:hypothetical protein